ncbi:hypothetical protein GGX14DRAFT_408766 [Mycena pura]|uniref:Uncharacterized protein n=1 Tax=Mycena pura TaxID=153505 RepID=A0AAD6UM74_9AGAR|nr:hypothetical protein GGX14DRAFT_408766 [Mycena pura]
MHKAAAKAASESSNDGPWKTALPGFDGDGEGWTVNEGDDPLGGVFEDCEGGTVLNEAGDDGEADGEAVEDNPADWPSLESRTLSGLGRVIQFRTAFLVAYVAREGMRCQSGCGPMHISARSSLGYGTHLVSPTAPSALRRTGCELCDEESENRKAGHIAPGTTSEASFIVVTQPDELPTRRVASVFSLAASDRSNDTFW